MKELFLQYVQKRRQVMGWVKVVFVCYPVAAFFQPFLYMSLMNGENRVIVDTYWVYQWAWIVGVEPICDFVRWWHELV